VHPGLRRALFPQRAGTLTISAPEVGVGMRRRVGGRATTVEVLPLPSEGRPADFSANNVGLYTIAAKVDRAKVKQGEPFTLTITIAGTGNIRVIDPGAWPELDGLRRYDPKVETRTRASACSSAATRSTSFSSSPSAAGALQVPPHSFSFFDPATARTRPSAPSRSRSCRRRRQCGGPERRSATTPPRRQGAGERRRPARPPHHPGRGPSRHRRHLLVDPATLHQRHAPRPAALAVGGLARGLWRRFGPDDSSRASAARLARQRSLIAQAEAGVASGEGFYHALSQLLQALAVERAGAQGEGLPRRALLELLARKGSSRTISSASASCSTAVTRPASVPPARPRAIAKAALDDALALLRRSSLAPEGAGDAAACRGRGRRERAAGAAAALVVFAIDRHSARRRRRRGLRARQPGGRGGDLPAAVAAYEEAERSVARPQRSALVQPRHRLRPAR
jgi:hypothetical protein